MYRWSVTSQAWDWDKSCCKEKVLPGWCQYVRAGVGINTESAGAGGCQGWCDWKAVGSGDGWELY